MVQGNCIIPPVYLSNFNPDHDFFKNCHQLHRWSKYVSRMLVSIERIQHPADIQIFQNGYVRICISFSGDGCSEHLFPRSQEQYESSALDKYRTLDIGSDSHAHRDAYQRL